MEQDKKMEQYARNIPLIGQKGQEKLKKSSVIVFGVGGVGGFVCEALARCGVGQIDVVDGDVVEKSNINRQIIADFGTIGQNKAFLMRERMLQINPEIICDAKQFFYNQNTEKNINFTEYDYVIDAIDDVPAKLLVIKNAKDKGTSVISAMGTGNKLRPDEFAICDIEKTSVCPLARIMRQKLRKLGIKGVKVLYSKEEPKKSKEGMVASISFVPSVAGLMMAGEVVRDLVKK